MIPSSFVAVLHSTIAHIGSSQLVESNTIRADAIDIWKAGVAAVHGRTLVENSVQLQGDTLLIQGQSFTLNQFDRILVVGGGKFSHNMAEGMEHRLGPELSNRKNLAGLVTVPDGANQHVRLRYIEAAECRPAGVNLPTDRVLTATNRMLAMLRDVDERTLVIALISGGGSALLESSALPLDEIIAATNWLSSHGANILELNTVRIALSNVKGGGLARVMPTGTLVGLIVSDVPNDDLRFVSSGPTVEFGSGLFSSALAVLKKFGALNESNFPPTAIAHIESAAVPTKVKAHVANFLIGDAEVARQAATAKAAELGFEVDKDVLSETKDCDQIADAVSDWLSQNHTSKQAVISLGEPVVEPGESAGQGGRNQHAVLCTLAKLINIDSQTEFCFMSAGTDGEDGNTSVAGGCITNASVARLSDEGTAISESLARFDSHTFLKANGLLFDCGPTATNVADLRVILRK